MMTRPAVRSGMTEQLPGEGAVPIRVHGSLVGVLAISGLESGGDHDLAVSGLRAEP
jgi:uncharacterized protein (UPF0303 family)